VLKECIKIIVVKLTLDVWRKVAESVKWVKNSRSREGSKKASVDTFYR
jgi:hypothetical protein